MRGPILNTILACLFVLTAQPGLAQIVVSPEGEINSIKRWQSPAHVVQPGTYMESDIGIDKSLTLEGTDYPIIDGNKEGYIFVINADNVTIKGFEIKRTGRS